tara:strand:+ start:1313 stop:1417 length:105 start_codon:yes stop_codon:yes gene_type:complete
MFCSVTLVDGFLSCFRGFLTAIALAAAVRGLLLI